MGCAMSKIDREERVVICKERKKVMKQLLGYRAEFSSAVLAYLRALKNNGVTLKQFTESELLELESALPPSPPLPLPPSPPLPPPIDSPDFRKREGKQHVREVEEEVIEFGEDSGCTPSPPPLKSSWDLRNLLDTSTLNHGTDGVFIDDVEEESWAETRSQFDEEDHGNTVSDKASNAPRKLNVDVVEKESTIVGGQTKDLVNMAMVVWRRKKTLPAIIKELDDYFLKASAGGKEIAVLVDIGARNASLHHDIGETRGNKGNNSARVLSSLSWSRSSRSLQLSKDEAGIPFKPCKAGAHCITLEKLYAEEQILYKAVRDEEMAKRELKRKSLSLQKLEDENTDLNKIEKTRSTVDKLQSEILRLQELVKRTCSTILSLIGEELHPQLVSLLSGLSQMWRTMSECHQFQSHISQQLQNLSSHHNTEPTTDYHRDATVQLESEVNFWYNSFCRLMKCQREYVKALSRWSELSNNLVDGENPTHCPLEVSDLCKNWQLALDRLPEKVVSEAIKRFLVVIRSIILQHEEECSLKKKTDRLERKFHRDVNSLIEIEKKLDLGSGLSPKHPLSIKRAKTDALRRQYENEKAKYLSSIQVTRAMTLHHLQTSLPHVFQALTEFSSACAEAFETALNHAQEGSTIDSS